MLRRTPQHPCVECGLAYGAAGFAWHGDREQNGPAYWSDRGVLCSARCAARHMQRRQDEGAAPPDPAPPPRNLFFGR